ncbi:MAG: hypothetical protein HYX27_27250 [Acidobacteria bacterium]|nr:hypothetical protein [Acidobacteriota bacterium]
MNDELHHTHYDLGSDGNCFEGGQVSFNIDKKDGKTHKILIHNNSALRALDFEFIVCSAKVTHPDDTVEHLDPASVNPFTVKTRRRTANPRTAAEYTVSPMIGNDPKGHIVVDGAFVPLRPCTVHNPCSAASDVTILTHTDWHIEC